MEDCRFRLVLLWLLVGDAPTCVFACCSSCVAHVVAQAKQHAGPEDRPSVASPSSYRRRLAGLVLVVVGRVRRRSSALVLRVVCCLSLFVVFLGGGGRLSSSLSLRRSCPCPCPHTPTTQFDTQTHCRSGLVFRCGKFFSSALRSVRRTKSLVCGESMRGGGSQNLGEPRQRSDVGVWFRRARARARSLVRSRWWLSNTTTNDNDKRQKQANRVASLGVVGWCVAARREQRDHAQ